MITDKQIKAGLSHGLSYAEISRKHGVSRQRVNKLAHKHKLYYCVPDSLLLLREYSRLKGISWKTIDSQIRSGRLSAIKLYGRWYINKDEKRKCRRCGSKLDNQKHSVCDDCKKKVRNRCHWRYFYRHNNMPLVPSLGYIRQSGGSS